MTLRPLLLTLSLLAVLPATPAQAGVQRYAIIVGANRGDPEEVHLRYAESDARRIATILQEVGSFAPENVLVLTNTEAPELRRVVIDMNARIRDEAGGALLFVFFSGHADAEALHLNGSHFPIRELRALIYGSSAAARILVVDACRSGAVTRIKGGRPGPSFAITFDEGLGAEGVAILTSSAAGEDAQESDALRASFFTHFLASGLIGAADGDEDGNISLGEAFRYASERTLAATVSTVAGPQHPTYRFDLGGREDLVITRPGLRSKRFGGLSFPPGTYLVHKGRKEGNVIAEVTAAEGGRQLALAPGKYFITQRARAYLRQGTFDVESGSVTEVVPATMKRVAYAQVVRKGGTERHSTVSSFVLGGVRTPIQALGPSLHTDAGVRLDLHSVSTELRVGLGEARHRNDRVQVRTRELAVTAAALKAFDLRFLTVSAGIEGGGVWFNQSFDDVFTKDRDSYGIVLAPVGQAEVPLWRGLHARADAAVLTYFLRFDDGFGRVRDVTPVSVRGSVGLGWYFQ